MYSNLLKVSLKIKNRIYMIISKIYILFSMIISFIYNKWDAVKLET